MLKFMTCFGKFLFHQLSAPTFGLLVIFAYDRLNIFNTLQEISTIKSQSKECNFCSNYLKPKSPQVLSNSRCKLSVHRQI